MLPLPAAAATICDDLATALRRGDGTTQGIDSPSYIIGQLARKSGGHIRIADESSKVPAAYKVEGFDNPKLSRLGSEAVALVETQGSLHCEQWAFFDRVGGKIVSVKAPKEAEYEEGGGGLCWDSFGEIVSIGGVTGLLTEDDGDNRLSLSFRPWRDHAWDKACRVDATFRVQYRVDGAYCKGRDCPGLQAEALALVPRYRALPKRKRTAAKDPRRAQFGEHVILPTFDISSSNPYTAFIDETLQTVSVNGRKMLAVVGGGMFGWREYRGNLVGFWPTEGELPIAGYQIELGNAAVTSLRVTPDIDAKKKR